MSGRVRRDTSLSEHLSVHLLVFLHVFCNVADAYSLLREKMVGCLPLPGLGLVGWRSEIRTIAQHAVKGSISSPIAAAPTEDCFMSSCFAPF